MCRRNQGNVRAASIARKVVVVAAMALLGGAAAAQQALTIHVMPNRTAPRPTPRSFISPNGGTAERLISPNVDTGNGMDYNGGPIMSGNINVYLIWYGNWSGDTATTILPDFMSHIGGSSYFNINTTYSDSNDNVVANIVTYAGSTTDSYSQGTQLTDAAVEAIVSAAITGGRLPADAAGVYFVLTSPDVNETSGWCSQYCGWHTHGTIEGTDIKFAFIGDPANCSNCLPPANQTSSPNGNVGADAMASVMAHELEESATDPDLNAWIDPPSVENADLCAWTYGHTIAVPATNNAAANVVLGDRAYLIQQNWINEYGGGCRIAKQINSGGWIQITNDIGDVLPEVGSLYMSQLYYEYGYPVWQLNGTSTPIAAAWGFPSYLCSAASIEASGIRQPGPLACRYDATTAVYGHQ